MSPTSAPTRTLAPTPTPNLTSTATPIPSLTPTATPYTLKGYQGQYQTVLKGYSALGLNDTEFRYIFFESGLYHDRVLAKITADVNHEQEQVWVRHILVADEATSTSIRTQLLAGADFTDLAAQSSLDTATKDKGGDLGWLGLDPIQFGTDFATAAFSLKVGETSQPIKSTYGYHILQVLGHEVRPLTAQQYQDAVTAAFNTWLQDQRTNATIVINSSWTNLVPTSPTIADAQAADAATRTAYISTYQAGSTP
jgi:parvulin-like peptidyl-prolyl isomerase